MMTQSVMTQASNLIGSTSGGGHAKVKQGGSGFDFVMERNLKTNQNNDSKMEVSSSKREDVQTKDVETDKSDTTKEIANESTKEAKNVETDNSDTAKETAKETANESTKEAKNAETDKSDTTIEEKWISTKKSENVQETKKSSSVENTDSNELSEEQLTMAQINSVLQSIREVVLDKLELTSDELNQLLESQGLSEVDLFQSDVLKQLLLTNSQESNVSAFLTNENLAGKMKELIQAVEQIRESNDFSLTIEQIKDVLAKAESGQKEHVLNEESMIDAVSVNHVEDGKIAKTQENGKKSTTENMNQKEIQVEVTRVSDTEEANTGSQADLRRDENQELESKEQFNVFLDNLVKSSGDTQIDYDSKLVQITQLRDVANQIIERIKVMIKPEQTSMELQLNPEELGKVNLTVQSKAGVMTAQFVVQNEVSKEAIEGQLNTLRETLNHQGIKVEAIEVTVATYSYEQSNQADTNEQPTEQEKQTSKKITLEDAMNMNEMLEEDEDNNMIDFTRLKGNQIDYTA